ncbi:MAG: hypothetical protein EZS28_024479 [Streblomastix strix]|uniref:Tyr recombinase domain-containing protein n=1 Tax=Streblomastix strix TaxID=222440 RepID=A0A5J4VBQ9_9EUKA|nr:MAG: hypothetical protein EZS28_024479 [Streblomastix strix]
MALLVTFAAARMTELTRMKRKDILIDEQRMMLYTKIKKDRKMREYTIELRRQGKEYCPVGAQEKWLWDGNCWKGDDSAGSGQVLRNVLDEIGIEKQYGGVTIRHAMMTKLRREGATQEEEVNTYTRHAPGSNVVDFYDNKAVGRDLSTLLLLKQKA